MVLIGVLSARASGAEPTIREIVLSSFVIIDAHFGGAGKNRHRYRGSMYSSAFFCWGNPLNSVAASFVFKAFDVASRNRHLRGSGDDLVLSALGRKIFAIDFR